MGQAPTGQPIRRDASLAELGSETRAVESHRLPDGNEDKLSASLSTDSETRSYVISSRAAQGIPERVTDLDVLAAIQRALHAPYEPNPILVEARTAAHASGTDNDAVKKSA